MKLALICITFLIGTLYSVAQPGFTIEQKKQAFGAQGILETYELMILQAQKEDVVKGLVKQLQKGTRAKATESTEMISISKVFYEDYWLDSLSIMAIATQKETGTLVLFSFDDDGQSVGQSTHAELHLAIKKYLKNFALNMYEDAVKDELKKEEGRLKDIEKELKSAIKDEDKIRKKIEGVKIDKTDKKEEIAQNSAARASKIEEIQAQKDKIAGWDGADKEGKKEEKSKLKALNKELKKFKKANKKMNKSVFKMDNEIRDLELERVKFQSLQKSIKERIDAKNIEINKINEKLYQIKEARD